MKKGISFDECDKRVRCLEAFFSFLLDRYVTIRDWGQVLFLVEIIEASGFNQQQARLASPYLSSSPFEARA